MKEMTDEELKTIFQNIHPYDEYGDNTKAIEEYTYLITLRPSFVKDVYMHRGYAYCDNKDYDKAIADFSVAIELDQTDANAYWQRGRACRLKLCYKESFEDIAKAVLLNGLFFENLETTTDIILRNNPLIFWNIKSEILKVSSNFFVNLIVKFIEAGLTTEKYQDLVISVIEFWKLCRCSRYNDRMVYQYTTLQTFELMRKSRRLRLNPASYQNDPNEGKIFFKFLKQYFEKETGKVFAIDTKNENTCTFVRSLTDLDDSIIMWNSSYCDNGLGVSVGLTQKSISGGKREGSRHQSSLGNEKYIPIDMVGLYKVQYISLEKNEKNQTRSERNAQKSLTKIADKLVICMNEVKSNKKVIFFILLSELLSSIAHLVKDKSYSHENEYRLMCTCSLQNEYSKKYIQEKEDATSNIFQGFYIETEEILFESKKHKIIFGPKVNDSIVNKYKQAFAYNDLTNVVIKKSKQDFR